MLVSRPPQAPGTPRGLGESGRQSVTLLHCKTPLALPPGMDNLQGAICGLKESQHGAGHGRESPLERQRQLGGPAAVERDDLPGEETGPVAGQENSEVA
jgi:hypothetical protein